MTGHGASRVLVLLASMAGGILLPAISMSGEPRDPAVAIVAPSKGATMPAGRALVIGKAEGKGIARVEIDVNGKGKQSAQVVRGGFSAPVHLSAGRNVIRARAGGESAALEVTASAKGRYVYHISVEKCGECHGTWGATYSVGAPKDSVCYRCHIRKDGKKLVHGPMGSGDCTACHDPHGSAHRALIVARPEVLCVLCHDQKSSAGHIAKARGKACTACHDPHSSDKVFLIK